MYVGATSVFILASILNVANLTLSVAAVTFIIGITCDITVTAATKEAIILFVLLIFPFLS